MVSFFKELGDGFSNDIDLGDEINPIILSLYRTANGLISCY